MRKITGSIALCLLVGMLAACLWPFNPYPKNHVSLPVGDTGLQFGQHGILLGRGSFEFPEPAEGGFMSFEIWLQPAFSEDQSSILTISTPDDPIHFELQQYYDEILIRRRDHDAQGRQRQLVMEIERVFRSGRPVLVTIVAGARGTTVYLDGRAMKTAPRFGLSRADLSGRLIFGSSPLHSDPWSGNLLGLAIYQMELDEVEVAESYSRWKDKDSRESHSAPSPLAFYRFDSKSGTTIHDSMGHGPDLFIPPHYALPDKPLLFLPGTWEMDRLNFWMDVGANIVGFIPFGFFVCAYFLSIPLRRPVLVAILAGSVVSLSIELLQFYLPLRDSDSTDLVTNFGGTVVGAVFFSATFKWAVRMGRIRGDSIRILPHVRQQ